jgi:TrmH family RNA methyltransferase
VNQIPPLTRSGLARIRDLSQSKEARDAEGEFLLEGAKPIGELLQAKSPLLTTLVVTPKFVERMPAVVTQAKRYRALHIYMCRETELARVSSVETHQGIVGVVTKPVWDESAILARDNLFGVLGDRIQDPSNVGAIIRIAAAFGLTAMWLTPESADPYNPKAVRAAAGTLLNLPVFSTHDPSKLLKKGCELLCAEASQDKTVPLTEIKSRSKRALLAFGNESTGLTPRVRAHATVRFHIPINPAVESLNVAASVAVASFYLSNLPLK